MPKPNPNLLAANAAAGYPQPILYLPLSDPTQPGKNLGTGGDFALNGVVARSGRGPSQFNAPYSDLNGTNQFVRRATALAGVANGKQFTLAFQVSRDNGGDVISLTETGSEQLMCRTQSNGTFELLAGNGGTWIVYASATNLIKLQRNHIVVISVDTSSTSKRHVYVDGLSVSVLWGTYVVDGVIKFNPSSTPRCYIGAAAANTPSGFFDGRLGNIFFDTKYIDLSQPANLSKFVTGAGIDAKPADLGANGEKPFGTPPLIYLPMYGNNAGKNYGTGGDFSVVSGPFAGSRGPNEFWGNKADFVPNAHLYSWTSLGTNKTLSLSFMVTFDDTNTSRVVFAACGSQILNASIQVQRESTANKLLVNCMSVSGTALYAESNTTFVAGTYFIQICIDLTDTNRRKVFANGAEVTMTYSFYNNYVIADTSFVTLGAYCSNSGASTSNYLDGKLSEFYFTTDYIDFSQEANRLKFRDAFGNPVDLAPQIAAGTLPNPAIYMRFDPANFGKNSGTGGDFVVNGTITDGGQL